MIRNQQEISKKSLQSKNSISTDKTFFNSNPNEDFQKLAIDTLLQQYSQKINQKIIQIQITRIQNSQSLSLNIRIKLSTKSTHFTDSRYGVHFLNYNKKNQTKQFSPKSKTQFQFFKSPENDAKCSTLTGNKVSQMISSPNQKKVTFYEDEPQQRIMNQNQHPMSIEQMDDLSMNMGNCLHEVNYRDMDDNDFSLFGKEQEIEKERQEYKNEGNFYSQHCITHETGNTDLDCYLND